MEHNEKNKVEASTLYLVATPIGNLADISQRAIKVLSEVDFVAAEDTRNSMKLLSCLGVHKELVSYYEHNKKQSGEKILARLINGESCALITDAGMPAISDPGEDIVRLCADANVKVTVVPGCCAAVSALSLSGLPTTRFTFEGFLPVPKKERQLRLEELKSERRTMILYEAPHKLKNTLKDLALYLGEERQISLCREITKLNEEVLRTTLAQAIGLYDEKEPRGEYVLVIEGTNECQSTNNDLLSLTPEEHVAYYENAGLARMDAIKKAAKDRDISKSELYKILIK